MSASAQTEKIDRDRMTTPVNSLALSSVQTWPWCAKPGRESFDGGKRCIIASRAADAVELVAHGFNGEQQAGCRHVRHGGMAQLAFRNVCAAVPAPAPSSWPSSAAAASKLHNERRSVSWKRSKRATATSQAYALHRRPWRPFWPPPHRRDYGHQDSSRRA